MSDRDFEYSLIPLRSHGLFWITFIGEINMERLARAHDAFTSHPDYVPGIDELIDFTQSSIKLLTRRGIEMIRRYMVEKPDRHHSKSVIVVGTEVEYGLGRMMGSFLEEEVPVDRWICYSIREALEWLRPGQADELLDAYREAVASGDS